MDLGKPLWKLPPGHPTKMEGKKGTPSSSLRGSVLFLENAHFLFPITSKISCLLFCATFLKFFWCDHKNRREEVGLCGCLSFTAGPCPETLPPRDNDFNVWSSETYLGKLLTDDHSFFHSCMNTPLEASLIKRRDGSSPPLHLVLAMWHISANGTLLVMSDAQT